MPPTHEVFNQSPPLTGYDVAGDSALLDGLNREEAGWAEPGLHELGRRAGSGQAQEWGRLANENPPVLRTHDRFGNRIDEVEFHPAWHELMTVAVGAGLQAAPWADRRPGAHTARAAGLYVWGATDFGHLCPMSMSYSIVPALRHAPELARRYEPLLTARVYDPGSRPPESKRGLLAGMSMTEKQGGSDVRANTTRAVATADGSYRLTGHKWFTSAPMNDLFLVLAQVPGGQASGARPGHCRAFCCRGCCRTAPATVCGCSGSRTSSATSRTRRPRSSTTTRWPGWSVRRAAASRPSSRWST